jgi:hypothetical protein
MSGFSPFPNKFACSMIGWEPTFGKSDLYKVTSGYQDGFLKTEGNKKYGKCVYIMLNIPISLSLSST